VNSKPQRSRRLAVLAFLGLWPGFGCVINTQRWPGVVTPTRTPLPEGDARVRGPEEVLIVRHADPVQVRPAEFPAGFPLAFYNKRVRLNAGGSVIVAPGGRAEVLWPMGSSIVIFGEGVGVIGSPSRGEAAFTFLTVERAALNLTPGDQVELMGGAVLSGEAGPYVLERVRADILRVRNQSKGPLSVAFREELFDLGPGHVVDLPLLGSGGAPRAAEADFRQMSGPGFRVGLRGEIEAAEVGSLMRLRASGNGSCTALGVLAHLEPGDEVLFSSLGPMDEPAGAP
jgi:hypothetical protein